MIESRDVNAVGLRADGRIWISSKRLSGESRRGQGSVLVMDREEAQWIAGRLLHYLENGREVRDGSD